MATKRATAEWKIRRARQHSPAAALPLPSRPGVFVQLPTTLIGLVLAVAIAVGAALFIWQALPHDPGDDSAEAGFLRDMLTHHSQAVEMAMAIRDRTPDETLRLLATDIALTQSTDMGAMQGYLNIWDLGLTGADKPMAWMGHPVEGPMPGMASPEQVAELDTLPVAEAEVLFLQLMIRHHQGGVEMAEALLQRSDQPEVTLMAERISNAQNADIGTMNQMLVARSQPPITDPLPDDHNSGH
jgi:uncharacterized protein (DUF305 family)